MTLNLKQNSLCWMLANIMYSKTMRGVKLTGR